MALLRLADRYSPQHLDQKEAPKIHKFTGGADYSKRRE